MSTARETNLNRPIAERRANPAIETWAVGKPGFARVEVSASERVKGQFDVEGYDGQGNGFTLSFDRDKARELRDLLDRLLAD